VGRMAPPRWLRRPGERLGCKAMTLDLEEVKLDFQASKIIKTSLREFCQRIAIELARRYGNLLAIRKMAIAQQPAGVLRPRQHTKGFRIRDHDEIARAAHFWQIHATACFENGKDAAV